MVLFGLSIFIASISLLCLRHLPRAWFFLVWPRRGDNNTANNCNQNNDVTKMSENENDETIGHEKNQKSIKNSAVNQNKSDKDIINLKGDEISDIKAMPPPPIPSKKKASLSDFNSSIKTRNDILPPKSDSELFSHGKQNQTQPAILVPISPPKGKALLNTKSSFTLKPSSTSNLSPLPNRIPNRLASTSVRSTPLAKSTKKIMLKPGHSPLDWARLSTSSINLSGLPSGASYLKVPPSLLKQYTGRKGKDAWTVLGNKVYNITPYLPFHPGGEPELLRSAGRDGTKLFTEVHPWVNWEGMLSGCFVGIAVEEHEIYTENSMHEVD
ncbi:putative heme steroid binding protein [Erysiphe neolycopersici]|uniref:Putative heme steroid binding protein n=1 Tax=Erysiphe neolycopersici TaxID=212602 RepID=A0A420HFR0_9PEZI|nr:putative heme steroid binding protein [Erysiphe neolycopersici]